MNPIYRQKRRTNRVLLLGVMLVVSLPLKAQTTPATEVLPMDIQVDLLVEDLRQKRESEDHAGVIEVISRIRALDTPFPDFLLWVEAKSLSEERQILAARDRLLAYLRNAGKEGRFYTQAKALLVEITPQAEGLEQAMREEQQKRAREAEQAEHKATVLRTQDAQRFLAQLGYLVSVTGELGKPTREAVAVYQIRRDLVVNGEITDEVIDRLRTEVPDEHVCDDLAHYSLGPTDWQTVDLGSMDSIRAISECNDALREYPDVVRFQIQYARALGAARRGKEALLLVEGLARDGSAAAEYLIAELYLLGQLQDSGKPDYENAIPMFSSAADRGYALGQHRLGSLFEQGTGVSRSQEAAAQWYQRAGAQGYVPAQLDLGRMLVAGRGVRRDYVEALRWYKQAALSDNSEAYFRVGEMYDRGRGMKRDKSTALEWYLKAANKGHSEASVRARKLAR